MNSKMLRIQNGEEILWNFTRRLTLTSNIKRGQDDDRFTFFAAFLGTNLCSVLAGHSAEEDSNRGSSCDAETKLNVNVDGSFRSMKRRPFLP